MTTASGAHPIAAVGNQRRPRVALADPSVWRDAGLVWLVQHMLFLLVTIAGQMLIVGAIASPATLLRPWVSWDALWYAQIARAGYSQPPEAAFYPLYPLFERLVALFTNGHVLVAGLLISNAACLGAFVTLRVLVEHDFNRAVARRLLLYVACFPYGFFLAAAYTESLFLLLSAATFLALRRERWLLAGCVAALATLTRPVGILLVIPLAIEGFQGCLRSAQVPHHPWRVVVRLSISLAAPILALVGFWLFLARRFGTPLATVHAQQSSLWQRRLSWPWEGLGSVTMVLVHGHGFPVANVVLDLLFTVIFIVLAGLLFRRVRWSYALYAWASLGLVLVTPIHTVAWAALSSNPRLLLVVFPLFIPLARIERRWANMAIVALSLVLLGVLGVAFGGGAFLA